MVRRQIVTLVAASLLTSASLRAQCPSGTGPGVPLFTEHAFFDTLEEDLPPGDPNTPLTLVAPPPVETLTQSALAVELADIDEDGVDDILLGGSSGFIIFFLQVDANVRRSIRDMEVLAGTFSCYDFRVDYLDDDDHLDIAMSRNGSMDKVFLHGGLNGTAPAHSSGLYYPIDTAHVVDLDPTDHNGATTPTRGMWVADIDQQGGLDLVTAADKVRYWRGDGFGGFDHVKSYPGNGRVARALDVNDDTWADLIVAGDVDNPDEIWLNNIPNGASVEDPYDDEQLKQQLVRPTAPVIGYQQTCDFGGGQIQIQLANVQPFGRTYEVYAPDLDGDDDPDLVIASRTGPNAAYVNDGTGTFGCKQGGTFQPGEPAWRFPDVTEGWTGWDECMLDYANALNAFWGIGPLPGPNRHCTVQLDFPGELFSDCTGVATGDVAGSDLHDVVFSNRNDIQQIMKDSDEAGVCDHDPGIQPLVCDFVFINTSTQQDVLQFNTCIELVMEPNDGTGYSELADVDGDTHLDWIDANFANDDEDFVNRVYWGTGTGAALSCGSALVAGGGDGGDDGRDDLLMDFGAGFAGQEFVLLASPSLGMPRFLPRHAQRNVDLADVLAEAGPDLAGTTSAYGLLDEGGRARWVLDDGGAADALFVSVAVLDGERRLVAVANAAVPLR